MLGGIRGQEEKGTTEDEMAGWHHQLNGHEFEWTPGVGDGQGGLACCNSRGRKESDTTEWLNWTELNWKIALGRILISYKLGYIYIYFFFSHIKKRSKTVSFFLLISASVFVSWPQNGCITSKHHVQILDQKKGKGQRTKDVCHLYLSLLFVYFVNTAVVFLGVCPNDFPLHLLAWIRSYLYYKESKKKKKKIFFFFYQVQQTSIGF